MTQEFVIGTSGQPDYLIVARKGRCAIGVKAELGVSSKHRVVGMGLRVRVCADPKQDFSAQPLTATEIAQTLPHVAMPNTDAVRGSFSMQGVFKIPLDESLKQGAMNRAQHKDTVLKFIKTLQTALKLDLLYSELDLAEWFQSRWERAAMNIGASGDSPTASVDAAVSEFFNKLAGKGDPSPEEPA